MDKWWNQPVLACAPLLAMVAGLPMAVHSAPRPADTASITAPLPSTPLTLDRAVAQVRRSTHGKVLRAGTRQYGNTTEYLVKVLTPDGHVRVVPVRSQPGGDPAKTHEETH